MFIASKIDRPKPGSRAPALWIHGHTHDSFDYLVGPTRIVCNPKGNGPMRPGRRLENMEFDVRMVIEA